MVATLQTRVVMLTGWHRDPSSAMPAQTEPHPDSQPATRDSDLLLSTGVHRNKR